MIHSAYKLNHHSALKRAVAVLLVVVLLAGACATLFACDNTKSESTARAEAVTAFKTNTLAALDTEWRPDMSASEIESLTLPGSYVVANGWVNLIADTLSASTLQTAKISYIAEYVATDEGKALLADVASNVDSLLGFFSALGLTSSDVQNVGYDLMQAVLAGYRDIYQNAVDTVEPLRAKLTGTPRNDINSTITQANTVLNSAYSDEEILAEAASALGSAESSIKVLLGFGYTVYSTFGAGSTGASIMDMINNPSGALSGLTVDEMYAWVSGLLGSISQFADDLRESDLAALKSAVGSIMTAFEGLSGDIAVLEEVANWLGYAEAYADDIPTLMDYFVYALECVEPETNESGEYEYTFLNKVLTMAQYAASEGADATVTQINTSILLAELIVSFTENVSAEQLIAQFETSMSGGETEKLVLLYAAAAVQIYIDEGDAAVENDQFMLMACYVFTELGMQSFTSAYNTYVASPTDSNLRRLNFVGGLVINFIQSMNTALAAAGEEQVELNVDGLTVGSEAWKDAIATAANEIALRFATGSVTQADAMTIIENAITAFYDTPLDDIKKIAALDVLDADSTQADMENAYGTIENSSVGELFTYLISMLSNS